MAYTTYNKVTHAITGRVSSAYSLINLSDDEDWIEGDYDDRFYNIAPPVDEESAPTPYLKPEPYDQQDLRKMIIKERKRRQELGFDFDFKTIPGGNSADPRGIHHFGTTREDLEGWDEVTKYADLLEKLDQPNEVIDIDTDTGPVQIQAWEWKFILMVSGQARQPLWKRAAELSYLNPIPQDVISNEAYWDTSQPLA